MTTLNPDDSFQTSSEPESTQSARSVTRTNERDRTGAGASQGSARSSSLPGQQRGSERTNEPRPAIAPVLPPFGETEPTDPRQHQPETATRGTIESTESPEDQQV